MREAEEVIGAVVAEEVLDKGDWKPRAQVATSIDVDAEVDDDGTMSWMGKPRLTWRLSRSVWTHRRRLIMCPDSFLNQRTVAWPCSSRQGAVCVGCVRDCGVNSQRSSVATSCR